MALKICYIVFAASVLFSTCAFCEGEVKALKQFEYWDNGNVRTCALFDANGFLKSKYFYRYDSSVEKIEKFDRRGNKIEESLYDDRGKLKAGIGGWAAMRWWYDDENNLMSQITYDEYGKPKERKHYSDSGRLILRQSVGDEDLNPYEEAWMAVLLGRQNVKYVRQEDALD